MTTFVLPTEADAIRVVRGMSNIVQQYGQVTLADVNDLLGLSGVFTDNHMGWKNTNHTLTPVDDGVELIFPEPIDFRNESAVRPAPETIQIVFEIENRTGIEGEQEVLNAFNSTPLRLMAKATSFNKRPGNSIYRPRLQYNSPVRSYGMEDV